MSAEVSTLQGLCVDVKVLVMGQLQNNVYIISDSFDEETGDYARESAGFLVVDPTEQPEAILAALGDAKLDAIVLTHAHWDHTGAASKLRELTGAPVIASAKDADDIENPKLDGTTRQSEPCKVDRRVSEGDIIEVGNMQWKVIETPGHTRGSMCLFCSPRLGNHADGLPVLISGDTLFAGTTGRTDFEGGSITDMAASIKKLAKLPDDTVVLPGHNSFTTIGAERSRVFAKFGA